MKRVYKYSVKCTEMPKGAEILSLHQRRGEVFVWALVDPDAAMEPRQFVVYPTGWSIATEPLVKFIGSVFLDKATYVFHVFEVQL